MEKNPNVGCVEQRDNLSESAIYIAMPNVVSFSQVSRF